MCATCQYQTTHGITVDGTRSNSEWARIIGVDEASIRRHRKHATRPTQDTTDAPTDNLGTADIGPDGGEFRNIRTDQPITDWTDVFRRFNLDPDAFEIIGDTVRMSTWQQSKRTETGDRDIVNLYS